MRPDDLTSHRQRRDDLEARLTAALDHRAGRTAPEFRLDTILERAHGAPSRGRSGAARWTLGLVAAAAIVALTLVLPGLLGGTPGATPMLPGSSTTATAPTPSTTPEPSAPTTPAESPSEALTGTDTPSSGPTSPILDSTLAALPVYYPAHIGDDLRMIRLYREWVNVDGVFRDDPVEERLHAALLMAMHEMAPHTDGYLNFWSDVELDAVQVTPDEIRITVDHPGGTQVHDAEEARIGVQQLVWTAQAVVGEGTIPVRFEIADGSTGLLGHLPVSTTYNRPASTDLYYEDLAPIWITSPTRYQAVDGPDVTVTGEATVFEGGFQWELLDETGAVVASGHGTASAGAPARATYEIELTGLTDGLYQIRVFEMSMADDGRVNAETSMPFFVGPAGEIPSMP